MLQEVSSLPWELVARGQVGKPPRTDRLWVSWTKHELLELLQGQLFPESSCLRLQPRFPRWRAVGPRRLSGFCSPGFQSSCTPMLTRRLSPPDTPRTYSLPTLVLAHWRKRSSAITSSTWGDPMGNRGKAGVYLHIRV